MIQRISAATIAALVVLGFVLFLTVPPSHPMFQETGFIELAQIAVTATAAVIWLAAALRPRAWEGGAGTTTHPSIALFFGAICFVVVARETTYLAVYGVNDSIAQVLEIGVVIIFAATVLGLIAYWLRAETRAKRLFRMMFKGPAVWWTFAAFVLVLSGDIFEKQLFDIRNNIVWEEMLELMGYVAINTAGLLVFFSARPAAEPRHLEGKSVGRRTHMG